MENNIVLNLTVEEVNAVLEVLGKLPTNSGIYPLLVKIQQQGSAQVQQQQVETPAAE